MRFQKIAKHHVYLKDLEEVLKLFNTPDRLCISGLLVGDERKKYQVFYIQNYIPDRKK